MLTVTFSLPRFIVRGRAEVLTLVTSTAPSSNGTYNLYNESGNLILTGIATATLTGASYSLAGNALDSQNFGVEYLEEWVLTIDGKQEIIKRSVILCRSQLLPLVSVSDLTALHHNITGVAPSTDPTYSTKIETAWELVLAKLLRVKTYPQTILNPWMLKDYHVYITLNLIAEDLATKESGQGKWTAASKLYADKAEALWDELQFAVDVDEDHSKDVEDTPVPMLLLHTPRRWF
jgi:hypothetical protein